MRFFEAPHGTPKSFWNSTEIGDVVLYQEATGWAVIYRKPRSKGQGFWEWLYPRKALRSTNYGAAVLMFDLLKTGGISVDQLRRKKV
jgi:hypothetical protein